MGNERATQLLEALIELLDIPPSYYKKAEERYLSLGDWFHREGSKVAKLSPHVHLQGSFLYGTVTRPLFKGEEFDLDLVALVQLAKAGVTQKVLKALIGDEIKAYAEAHSFKENPEEKKRCWRLNYADDVSFHMDILPAIPEDLRVIEELVASGVTAELAATAIAITDLRHREYGVITSNWPSSNPKGFAGWFEGRMRQSAMPRIRMLVEGREYASVEDVPPYEWKTTLQRSIQILKRHRDVMFKDADEWAPISMIITTLAAHAYGGQDDLYEALTAIVDGMPKYVRDRKPRVPNPVNPAEDFADRWATDPRYEEHFWLWHTQVKADIDSLPNLIGTERLEREIRKRLLVNLTPDHMRMFPVVAVPAIAKPTIQISTPAKPWGSGR
ncbi:MAG: nucleotidyltransferase [Planctomycetota bacterium]|nr:nucleotidyltransferase [Planctomycetota bacterium]